MPTLSYRCLTATFATTALLAAALETCAPAAYAQSATFTDVANSTSTGFTFFTSAAVNNSGVVAFEAGPGSVNGIYSASNIGSFTAVALTSSPEFSSFNNTPVINNAGVVAFSASRDAGVGGGSGIYKATNSSSFTTVALTSSPEFSGFVDYAINDAGLVAFPANRDAGVGGGGGLYTATNSSSFTTIGLSTDPVWTGFSNPDINNAGTIAVHAGRDTGENGIFTITASNTVTAIALASNPEFAIFWAPSINSSGTVAFRADRGGFVGQGIYTATDSSSFTTIARSDTSTEFSGFGEAHINDLGTVVFYANRDSGGSGIYAKLSSAADPFAVIRTGDALFGSTVTGLESLTSLADGSDIVAFQYFLANGVRGVARASLSAAAAPEPGTIALLSLGSAPLLGALIRRRTAV